MTETTKKKPAVRKRATTAKASRPRAAAKKATERPAKPAKVEAEQVVPAVVRTKPVHRTYSFAVGRRKSAIARVRYIPKGSGQFTVNGRDVKSYFPSFELQKIVHDASELTKFGAGADLSIKVHGGGIHGQAEAVRLGISRVFVLLQPDLRTTLKRAGFLRRDPRVKERKKYGLKRARRAPQWQKR